MSPSDGAAVLREAAAASGCESVAALYDQPDGFRSHVHMARHDFGKGEYRYFAYPLLAVVERAAQRACTSGSRRSRIGGRPTWRRARVSASHREYIERCHAAKQTRPTPLLLRYVAGDYNCLHQDLYGAEWFPLQVIVLLNAPEQDFQGGELMIVEQRPRAQSKGSVISLQQGDAAVIAVNLPPTSRRPRLFPRDATTWSEPADARPASYAGHHLSRRGVPHSRPHAGSPPVGDGASTLSLLLYDHRAVLHHEDRLFGRPRCSSSTLPRTATMSASLPASSVPTSASMPSSLAASRVPAMQRRGGRHATARPSARTPSR